MRIIWSSFRYKERELQSDAITMEQVIAKLRKVGALTPLVQTIEVISRPGSRGSGGANACFEHAFL